jgi:hypothetical protein
VAVRDVLLDTNAYAAFKQGMPDAVEVIAHTPRIGINSVMLRQAVGRFSLLRDKASQRCSSSLGFITGR